MSTCFVIQPFDKGNYDKRFKDVFEPGILKAGLTPYRVDNDPSVRVPIEDIERGIRESAIVFAEITEDNPNVWYELGYAFACGKDVVMVCAEDKRGKFPFDIQHRLIITYKTGSKSDFELLEEGITTKIKALVQTSKQVMTLSVTPVVETEGLKSHEIAILIILMENQITAEDVVSMHYLKDLMNKAGYTDLATSVGSRTLLKKKLIATQRASDWHGENEFTEVFLTEAGERWVLDNQDQLQFRKEDKVSSEPVDDLPF